MSPGRPEQQSFDRPITTPGQLLVEGRVPEMFFREMVPACGCESLLEVRTFGDISKDNLQTRLELFAQKAAFKEQVKRLGVIRDAESSNANSAFQSVQAALRDAQLPVPSRMQDLEGNPLSVGVFILLLLLGSGMAATSQSHEGTICRIRVGPRRHRSPAWPCCPEGCDSVASESVPSSQRIYL